MTVGRGEAATGDAKFYARELIPALNAKVAALRAEVAALQADKARLVQALKQIAEETGPRGCGYPYHQRAHAVARAAIDAMPEEVSRG